MLLLFFFNDTATTEIYTLSLHDALPICSGGSGRPFRRWCCCCWSTASSCHRCWTGCFPCLSGPARPPRPCSRSEEHTSELQSRQYLVCRLLLEKKKHKISLQQSITMFDT